MRRDRRSLTDCYWAAFALVLCSSAAMAADNWVKLSPLADNAGTLYLDKDSIERNKDGTVRATSRDAYDTPRKLAMAPHINTIRVRRSTTARTNASCRSAR